MPVKQPPAARRVCAALVVLAATGVACGPIVKPAVYRKRPDSVERGSTLGPFDGRVLDADTAEPIGDAIVWCSWAFDRGVGDNAPEAARIAETRTDADGRYRLPKLADFPSGLSTRLSRISLVIYKQGYVGYRHSHVFEPRWRRRDFAQFNNTVKLARWSPELSHAKHLLFLGGGASLRRASAWEANAAAAQLDGARGRRPLVSTLRGLHDMTATTSASPAMALLSSDDVRSITGFAGAFHEGPLSEPGDATFTTHLRATDRSERYDVGVRYWRLADEDAVTSRYEALLEALPGSRQKDKVGDRSFVVLQGEILGLGFMLRGQPAVVLLTCGKGQCADEDKLTALARKVKKNLERLARSRKEAP